ncbi:MAG: tetratricopeptide repeat protein [Methanothrix sp.]|jgi:tetratricopeptide (TPR) repeat protein|uniref:tetratricopeptide repeat protein n=1 Tax=Methanothrix sp. TaxID=90426 RepID=UPI002C397FE3|nr:tetratricopeptide repeat protein [Methanothrix sp.]MDI9417198.1 tetratricopeptide repeat protein [Euryarchaeota archaeon]HON36730.1 tetratricopeptide repeat protein [Methanothrix sp.]HRU75985.1 tetratricopeptide repeat protein [Methanothrix sp.]
MAQMDKTDLVYKAHESGEIRPGAGGLFGRTIELNPAENPFDWILKGNALRDGKRYDKAISAYEHSLQIDPDYPDAWMAKGGALSALERGEEAGAARARSEALKDAPSTRGSEHEIAELHLLFLLNISRRRVAYDFSQEQPRP